MHKERKSGTLFLMRMVVAVRMMVCGAGVGGRGGAGLRVSRRWLGTARRTLQGQNLIEKIVQRHVTPAAERAVRSGDFVSVAPAYVMTHDNTAAVMNKFKQLGMERFHDPNQAVFTLDHNVQDTSEGNLAKYKSIEDFAHQHGVTFFPAGRGIGHQVMCEEGFVFPNRMVVASDSHSNMYGGLGCLGTPIVRTDAAGIWATGKTWWQVPPVAKVVLTGALRQGVTGKDVIVTLCGAFNNDEVLNHAVEFTGDGVSSLSIDERLTIANMTTEWGALAGVFPVDDAVREWYTQQRRVSLKRGANFHSRVTDHDLQALAAPNCLAPDVNAGYTKVLTLDLSTVEPHVSGPNSVKVMHSIRDIAALKKRVHKAYLVSCVNSRAEDIARAAEIVRGHKVAKGVEFYVSPASSQVLGESEERGDWQALLAAGAIPLPPGCGPCIGLGKGLLEDGEVGISATNRNFRGRMGSRHAEAFLASPEVVAASAIAGYFTAPSEWLAHPPAQQTLHTHVDTAEDANTAGDAGSEDDAQQDMLPDFPARVQGRLVLCADSNINTDGIYPGKYTYREDLDAAMQAQVVMENYDESFAKQVQQGDVLVTGYNFGTGSSREQAATALKHAGVALVVCGSVNETYKRNALNNGLLVLEVPQLVDDIKKHAQSKAGAATFTSEVLDVDLQQRRVTWGDRTYPTPAVGRVAQELIVAGGLENWIRQQQQH